VSSDNCSSNIRGKIEGYKTKSKMADFFVDIAACLTFAATNNRM
jgi:hypothetical protein